jgi:hypothetical protein
MTERAIDTLRNTKLTSDFAGLQAGGANVLTLWSGSDQCAYALDVWIPAATRLAHRVGDVVAKAGAFAADIAVRSHG